MKKKLRLKKFEDLIEIFEQKRRPVEDLNLYF